MNLAHPLGVTFCQIVIDRNDLYAFPRQRIQICGTGRHQGFTFTCAHLCDTSLVQHDASDQLHGEMLHIQRSSSRLTDSRKCLRQEVVQRFSLFQTLPKDSGLVAQFLVGLGHHLRAQAFNLRHDGPDQLQLSLTVSPEHFFNYVHGILS